MSKSIFEELSKSMMIIDRKEEVYKYIKMAQEIIVSDNYEMRPYINTNQNQQYMRNLLNPNIENACVILSGADSIFQLLMNDVLNITAIDIQPLQKFIYELKIASLKSLNMSEYESFLVDRNNINFLSEEVFQYVKDAMKKDSLEQRFWELLLKHTLPEELKQYFFKGGLESLSIDIARNSLSYTKKKGLYYKVKMNLEKAKINIQIKDIVEYLSEHPEEKYDYIDITNVLLFMYQKLESSENKKFLEYIKSIRQIYDTNLNSNGIFVLDYMFGISLNELTEQNKETEYIKRITKEIYQEVYKILCEHFAIDKCCLEAIPGATPLEGKMDIAIYSKK